MVNSLYKGCPTPSERPASYAKERKITAFHKHILKAFTIHMEFVKFGGLLPKRTW